MPDRESINDRVMINRARFENDRGEAGFVRRVGKMLWLHAESIAELVNPAAFSFQRAIEEVAGIKLQARLAGKNFENPSRGWFVNPSHETDRAGVVVNHPVIIVAARELQLFIIL